MPHPSDGHAGHDQLLVAAYAAGDATGRDLDTATTLVATCDQCAALHRDLRSIAAATAALPAPARSRDFRLAPEQAASLRPAGWHRLLAPFAGPRFAFAGPLGGGLVALGLAGILLTGTAGLPLGGATSAPAGEAQTRTNAGPEALSATSPGVDAEVKVEAAQASPGDDIQPVPQVEAPAPADEVPDGEAPAAGLAEASQDEASAHEATTALTPDGDALPLVPIVSGLALLVGMVLVGLRMAGRRLAADA